MSQWIALLCLVFSINHGAIASSGSQCDLVGSADSHVLALSSQAGFCETYGFEAGKPECRNLSESSYQATHLTLHGLWPNKNSCGRHYGYCGVTARANHCDYAPVSLKPSTSEQLKQLMPSYRYGSCLERHEWNKHGRCQKHASDDYFSLAMKWAVEVDDSVFGDYLRTHKGQTVSLVELRQALGQAFGDSNQKKIFLGCKNHVLVDIYIQLPAELELAHSLLDLLEQAPEYNTRDMCEKKVVISSFSKNSWY